MGRVVHGFPACVRCLTEQSSWSTFAVRPLQPRPWNSRSIKTCTRASAIGWNSYPHALNSLRAYWVYCQALRNRTPSDKLCKGLTPNPIKAHRRELDACPQQHGILGPDNSNDVNASNWCDVQNTCRNATFPLRRWVLGQRYHTPAPTFWHSPFPLGVPKSGPWEPLYRLF